MYMPKLVDAELTIAPAICNPVSVTVACRTEMETQTYHNDGPDPDGPSLAVLGCNPFRNECGADVNQLLIRTCIISTHKTLGRYKAAPASPRMLPVG
jgi:hypothetical protein